MTYPVFHCTDADCWWRDFDEASVCPECGSPVAMYEAGYDPAPGIPNIISDELRPVFDNAAGRSFTSKSERRAFYKANHLRRTSVAEWTRHNDGMDHKCMTRTTSYPGQTDHRTASERRPNTKQ